MAGKNTTVGANSEKADNWSKWYFTFRIICLIKQENWWLGFYDFELLIFNLREENFCAQKKLESHNR